MLEIVITSHELEQLGDCQTLLCDIIKSQQHTQANGREVPQAVVDTWDKVKQLCDILYHHWEQAREQKEEPTKIFNLFISSKVKQSIESLQSVLEQERKLEVAIDDVHHIERWEAKLKEGVRRGDQQTLRWKMMQQYEKEYPKAWAHAPGVEAYRVLCALLRITKKKGWITDDEIGTLMNESDANEKAQIFDDHVHRVKNYLLDQKWCVDMAAEAESENALFPGSEPVTGMESEEDKALYRFKWWHRGDGSYVQRKYPLLL